MKTLIRTAFAALTLAGMLPAPVVADGGEPVPPPCVPGACPQQPAPGPHASVAPVLNLR